MLSGPDVDSLSISSGIANCVIGRNSKLEYYNCQNIDDSYDAYGICQYSECTAADSKICIFPFK